MPELHAWLMAKRQEAEARGGKALSKSQLASLGDDYRRQDLDKRLYIVDRNPEEIANPITGEVVTGCLSIGRLAADLNLTADKLTDEMETLGLVQRALDYRLVPMICQPAARKPRYFMTPKATLYAVEEGLVIPIEAYREGSLRSILLVTPDGQYKLRKHLSSKVAVRKRPVARREAIAELLREGRSQAEICRLTNLPKQTVSRHVGALGNGA